MKNEVETPVAKLYCRVKPDDILTGRVLAYLHNKYGTDTGLEWVCDASVGNGFRLEVGSYVYDWSERGLVSQLDDFVDGISRTDGAPIVPLLANALRGWTPHAVAQEVGQVISVENGVAFVSGLNHAAYGEILLFEGNTRGMVKELSSNRIGCILFGDCETIRQGTTVKRTGKEAGIPVGDAFIGRVTDALGVPVDGGDPVEADTWIPFENPAPGIIDRAEVNEPLETGILAIDSLFPIGKGQRELIIGDRQTGKTTIAVDAILNQKGKNVICIYVAIGQKLSSVSALVNNLRMNGAMDYTAVIASGASDSAAMQYIAPYAGCALAEYYMKKGKDVLIVYDDLSKHAVAYRAISLLLGQSPGREAYPGDVFYLHSRLLERAAHLSRENGGGSMTVLPIVETQAGDISAYIPTNIISITDGQIFLENKLFLSGQKPAINVGLSVSRVGSAAQTKALKSIVGTLRLDLAQYKEMEVFSQFASDLDENTQEKLNYGRSLMYLLRQMRNAPIPAADEVLLITAALGGALKTVPTEKIQGFKRAFPDYVKERETELYQAVCRNEAITPLTRDCIVAAATRYIETLVEQGG